MGNPELAKNCLANKHFYIPPHALSSYPSNFIIHDFGRSVRRTSRVATSKSQYPIKRMNALLRALFLTR